MWWVLVEALVRAVVFEMAHILVEDGEGMSLVVDQQPVGAVFANAANETFGVAIRSRRLHRSTQNANSLASEHGIEHAGEFAVAVSDQQCELSRTVAEALSVNLG